MRKIYAQVLVVGTLFSLITAPATRADEPRAKDASLKLVTTWVGKILESVSQSPRLAAPQLKTPATGTPEFGPVAGWVIPTGLDSMRAFAQTPEVGGTISFIITARWRDSQYPIGTVGEVDTDRTIRTFYEFFEQGAEEVDVLQRVTWSLKKGTIEAEVFAYVRRSEGVLELCVSAMESSIRPASLTEMVAAVREARNLNHAILREFFRSSASRR
jgi:hypothetical protein